MGHLFRKPGVRLSFGIIICFLGLVLLFISLGEGYFLSLVIGDLLVDSQGKQIAESTMHNLNSLVANGRISYLPLMFKYVLAVTGLFLIYLGGNKCITHRSGDNSIRALFTIDYWIKFNAIKYRKTRINSRNK